MTGLVLSAVALYCAVLALIVMHVALHDLVTGQRRHGLVALGHAAALAGLALVSSGIALPALQLARLP